MRHRSTIDLAVATCRMYKVGKGPIKVKDTKRDIEEKNLQKRPKKPVRILWKVVNFACLVNFFAFTHHD